jgi:hypothetical protein
MGKETFELSRDVLKDIVNKLESCDPVSVTTVKEEVQGAIA